MDSRQQELFSFWTCISSANFNLLVTMANTRASDDHQRSQLARYNKGLLLRICDGNMENTME
jgi:hypothetical protein